MDVVTLARTARENLARGLGALQSQGVPPELVSAAEPIASAMSALHRIESTNGAGGAEAAGTALNAVRQALGQLQTARVPHPAVDQAMESIAGSLGLVHQLSAAVGSVVPSPPTQPSSAYRVPAEQQPQVAVVQPQPGWAGQPQGNAVAATQLAQSPAWQQPAAQAAAQQPGWQQPAAQQPGWQQPAAPPQAHAPHGYAQAAQTQPSAGQHWNAPAAAAAAPAAAPAVPGNVLRVEAELGAHSSTNFYKGLAGNDVVDSGGIFIATYNIPEIGQPLLIKVSLPGGYEFEAAGIVRWTRDAPNSGGGPDASPGFGAQFTQISPEGRQLVYRYVRNREPLFHDDF